MESIRSHNLVTKRRLRAGFTLVELMVVLTIIVIITTVVLTSQSSFNKTLLISNTAYDIALTLRSAETFGLGSRAIGTTKNTGYGIHIENGLSDQFIFFADTYPPVSSSCTTPNCNPGDNIYTNTAGSSDTFVNTYKIGNGITISKFCVLTNVWICSSNAAITSLDIVFERPNPNATIRVNGSTNDLTPSITSACIEVTSPQGGFRYVTVGSTGQIIANATPCP